MDGGLRRRGRTAAWASETDSGFANPQAGVGAGAAVRARAGAEAGAGAGAVGVDASGSGAARQQPPVYPDSMGSSTPTSLPPSLSEVDHGEWVSGRPPRKVSLAWLEKILMLFLFFQQYGLLWALSKPWPWPVLWEKWSRFTLLFNLDFVSLSTYVKPGELSGGGPTEYKSIWGEKDDYWITALAWGLVPFFVLGVAASAVSASDRFLIGRLRDVKALIFDIVAMLGIVLSLPASLNLIRMYICEHNPSNEFVLAVDPSVSCFSGTHWAWMAALFPSLCIAMLGTPVWLYFRIKAVIVYRSRHKHERYLRWKEAEYSHWMSYDWRESTMWLLSSFRRSRAYNYVVWGMMQSCIVVIFAYGRGHDTVQADLYFSVIFLWALAQSVLPAYRCTYSNALAFLGAWTAAVNGWFAIMRAHRMKSVVVVDSNYFLSMIIVNTTAGVAAFLILLLAAFWPEPWPHGLVLDAQKASSNKIAPTVPDPDPIVDDSQDTQPPAVVSVAPRAGKFADDEPEVVSVANKRLPRVSQLSEDTLPDTLKASVVAILETQWIEAVLAARQLISRSQMRPPEMVDVPALMDHAASLRVKWKVARKIHHVLAWSLIEAMDDLAALADACRYQSGFPIPAPLLMSMSWFVEHLEKRRKRLLLVTPLKRRMLLKMLALTAWIGSRPIQKVSLASSSVTSSGQSTQPDTFVEAAPGLEVGRRGLQQGFGAGAPSAGAGAGAPSAGASGAGAGASNAGAGTSNAGADAEPVPANEPGSASVKTSASAPALKWQKAIETVVVTSRMTARAQSKFSRSLSPVVE